MVKTVAELVHVLLHILNRYVVKHAIHATFQYSPETFYSVGVDSVSERVCDGVVYFQPYKVTVIFFVEDIIASEIVSYASATMM